ncbi:hypothetical protein HH1059_03200 [Halorhodospira halochloris]|uniref:Uncharacterized protein n=1 Tax=Halorhodospira halochloris TaxID=1052 RepID=A0A2Z6EZ94_HALHR|nr:hypothetical protein HH1059_03200 [Halorhodospira halochloris]
MSRQGGVRDYASQGTDAVMGRARWGSVSKDAAIPRAPSRALWRRSECSKGAFSKGHTKPPRPIYYMLGPLESSYDVG